MNNVLYTLSNHVCTLNNRAIYLFDNNNPLNLPPGTMRVKAIAFPYTGPITSGVANSSGLAELAQIPADWK